MSDGGGGGGGGGRGHATLTYMAPSARLSHQRREDWAFRVRLRCFDLSTPCHVFFSFCFVPILRHNVFDQITVSFLKVKETKKTKAQN